ncbi:amino acid permease [Pediococcus pentosaceus]|uniref:amino acid permease n=1 Tax=Pediococcus pentosaceus TaxID=1255 RepID=UPI001330053A|nr:amino acid permease [Pediococcus pentosaceus]KAF0506344.1 amino acid permease [Pediococcus pentosaceus]MBF7139447.1 amino acid permease [Pediococcus pentosaceus]MCM6820052.1 amino acid permease [Pediococcus pentosaceus]
MEENGNNELARNLKSRHVQLIAIGGTIGTGLFLGAGSSIHLAGPSILLAYIVTGLVCFWLMRALGELLLSDLESTSFVTFVTKYLGKKVGFVTGWTYWICWITIAMAEITATGMYVRYWFPSVPQWIPGFIILILLIGLNLITVEAFGETEFWFSIIKIIAIVALIAIGFIMVLLHSKTNVGHADLTNLIHFGGIFPQGLKGFILSFQMVLFAFVGIEMVGMTAAETRDPKSVIPKAINEIPVRIGIFYVGALFFLMAIYPWNEINPNGSPFVQVFKNIGIPGAGGIINFVVLTAAASACNSSLFTTGRMLFSLTYGSSNKLGKRLGTLSKSQVPKNAILLSSLVIAVAVILNILMPEGVFTLISSIATTCFLFIWGTIVLAHLKYKKGQKQAKKEFSMPFFPISTYIVLTFLSFVGVVLLLQKETAIALIGSLIWFGVMFTVAKIKGKGELTD